MIRYEINGSPVPSQHCPPRVTIVYPEPEAHTLTGLPIERGYPTAILAWDKSATAATLSWWRQQAANGGRVTGIVLPDPRYGGPVVRGGTTYPHHSAWGYGVILAPTGDEGNSVEAATLYAPGPSAVLAEFGSIRVEIRDLGRYPAWPYP